MPSLIFQSDAHRHLVEALVNKGRWGGDGGGDGSSQQRNAPSGVLGAESASSTPLRSSPAVKSSKQPSVSARRVSSTTSPAISPAPVGAVTPKGRSKSRVAEDSGAAEDRLPPWVEFRDAILVPAVEKALDLAYRNRSQYVPNGKSADGRTTAPQGNQNNNNGDNSNGGGDSSSSLLKGHPSTPIIMRKLLSSNEGSSPSFNDNEKELPGVVMPIVFNEDDFLLENAEILNEVRGFSAPPFTLQRLCEILLDHEKHHVTSAAGGGGGGSSVAGSGKAEEPESPIVGTPGGNKGGKKRQRSNTPTRGTPSSAAAASSSSAPRIRGEKLQAALRRCALVSTTI